MAGNLTASMPKYENHAANTLMVTQLAKRLSVAHAAAEVGDMLEDQVAASQPRAEASNPQHLAEHSSWCWHGIMLQLPRAHLVVEKIQPGIFILETQNPTAHRNCSHLRKRTRYSRSSL